MNFSDIELKLRYPEAFQARDSLTPPKGVGLPAGARFLKVVWPSDGRVARIRSWLAI